MINKLWQTGVICSHPYHPEQCLGYLSSEDLLEPWQKPLRVVTRKPCVMMIQNLDRLLRANRANLGSIRLLAGRMCWKVKLQSLASQEKTIVR